MIVRVKSATSVISPKAGVLAGTTSTTFAATALYTSICMRFLTLEAFFLVVALGADATGLGRRTIKAAGSTSTAACTEAAKASCAIAVAAARREADLTLICLAHAMGFMFNAVLSSIEAVAADCA